ncbi:ornithine cyclodeaminase family protein [Rhizobium beringeri]|jgi:ornithine cyclodeaminase|uniref:ornithine cyclodeaminase family protein n=1 Tax=Rhizobium TaxID=379 RepID=UPI000FEC39F9|nr:ornithine cyclodeaminase family protein [Rhizobium leguminosarum]WSG72908.1 ornithine cyclodeaminase family protein [Rhizobium beringeri]NKL65043.1 ornithine cyclodeaminase family protein [Rhizobium leguminosarum bv. viciae]RWX18382.1 ornithine cyclodeaminase family protein [Rhizobium leguminosarum]TAU53642.1 ornithine cyclodeaminase family protein [Rhizobium leguminosarum]TBC94888.1 ornithine cyclodeaminase family protein [Rhizobium leguminosarum]
MTKILKDEDLVSGALMAVAIDTLETAFLARAGNRLISPPRHHVSFPDRGDLVFTVGGILGEKPLAGFRVYETFEGMEHSQIVAVWLADDARLKGIVLGARLGNLRTGAIGGLAIRHLSAPDARTVGILGSGAQARTQLAAAAAVRKLERARVYSRDAKNRAAFAAEMQQALGIEVEPAGSASKAVDGADIVICATTSQTPVIHARDLKPGVHVNTVGPKTQQGYELGLDIAYVAAVIATDSPEQTRAYASPFFLAGSGNEHRMADLADIIAGKAAGRGSPEDTTLFCSVGLAGTEVVVASAILDIL